MKVEKKLKLKKITSNMIFRFKHHDIINNSAALSFYFLQASIPLLMVLVSVVSRFLENNVDAIYSLIDFLPLFSKGMVKRVIDTMFVNTSSTSITVITVLFALWSATKGMNNLITSINKAYGLQSEIQYVKQRLLSLLYTIIFIVFIIFILVTQIYGPSILNFINNDILTRISDRAFGGLFDNLLKSLSSPLFRLTLTLVPILVIALVIGVFYRFAPYNKNDIVPLKKAFYGGFFATITIYISTFLYSFFLNNFSRKSVVYGALAGILALFIWLNLVSTILILGAELIDAIRENRGILTDDEIREFEKSNKTFKQTLEETIEESMNGKNEKNKTPDKKSLRKHFRDLRYHMDSSRKNMLDYAIFANFLNSDLFKKSESIFIYVSVADEVDTFEIIRHALEIGKSVYVPYITDPDKGKMIPLRIYDLDNLVPGEFNIPTSKSMEYMESIENPDLTIVPGLGYDKNKNRMGYGGGFYDRYLEKVDTISIGFFASDFEVEEIPTDEFDHKLNYIITEKGIF